MRFVNCLGILILLIAVIWLIAIAPWLLLIIAVIWGASLALNR